MEDRLVPEMDRNFAFLEGMLDRKSDLTLAQVAVLLEDAIDIHDRHWKIHWMLNFAQLSATLNLRAVMEETHGRVDESCSGGSRTPPATGTGTRSAPSGR